MSKLSMIYIGLGVFSISVLYWDSDLDSFLSGVLKFLPIYLATVILLRFAQKHVTDNQGIEMGDKFLSSKKKDMND